MAEDGIRYERPEVSLLYKAKHDRPKDRADFDVTLPLLDTDAVEWLKQALQQAHPGHAWLDRLS